MTSLLISFLMHTVLAGGRAGNQGLYDGTIQPYANMTLKGWVYYRASASLSLSLSLWLCAQCVYMCVCVRVRVCVGRVPACDGRSSVAHIQSLILCQN